MVKLRDYQERTIRMIYEWFDKNPTGNPCFVLPTGAGKSHVVAAFCKQALQDFNETRVLMLTHVKELIEQNAAKMREHWPNAPMGIYSASIGKRELGELITFAGIQSVRDKAEEIGIVDLIIIDECHLINNEQQGGYRNLIFALKIKNPNLRIIGLTATPYRLGQGLLTDGDNPIFHDIVEPVTIIELMQKGHLSRLQSKLTATKMDTTGVKKKGGEYIAGQLEKAVNTESLNKSIVDEIIEWAGDRKAWLIFCVGVDHAKSVEKQLIEKGISAACITGATPKKEREQIIEQFKAGEIRALTNCSVLTTGFDYPDIDCIAMCRPTLSPGLYVQMAGRGLRVKSHTDHCLVLDFAGVVERHGPIIAVRPPEAESSGEGEAPTKTCPECGEIVHAAVKYCPVCNFEFEMERGGGSLKLNRSVDIMGNDLPVMEVESWRWQVYTGRSGREMIRIALTGKALSDPIIYDYLTIGYGGYAGQKAISKLKSICHALGVWDDLIKYATEAMESLGQEQAICQFMNGERSPVEIKYQKEGRFYQVLHYDFEVGGQALLADDSRRVQATNPKLPNHRVHADF